VLLAVEDDGVGIPAENLSRLTDPFFTTKRESGGTGLGLSVSAGIVKEHGGSLQFSSRPGAGTTVVLSLPAIHEEADR
jgi:polar amino acid transport system substrate-binding protein